MQLEVWGSERAMLDAFIIEEIKRRHPEHHRDERPSVELPIPQPRAPNRQNDDRDPPSGGDRGVIIIDYSA